MTKTIHKEVQFSQPREQVWSALATSAALAEWMYPNDFEPSVGHHFTFRVPPKPEVGFDGLVVRCEVLECDPSVDPHYLCSTATRLHLWAARGDRAISSLLPLHLPSGRHGDRILDVERPCHPATVFKTGAVKVSFRLEASVRSRRVTRTETLMSAKKALGKLAHAKDVQKSAKGFTDEERAAMIARSQELKAEARADKDKAQGEGDVLAAIAAMPEPERAMAKRLHAIIKVSAPALSPKTWYGMPAYAKDGKVLCFFQGAQKFKTRYATLGFSDSANLDEGTMWPTAFAIKELTVAEEARIGALVKKAVS
jgi:hypothetical protein